MQYHYDGTFAGLLTVLAETLAGAAAPTAIVAEDPGQGDLFAEREVIRTDEEKACRFLATVENHLSPLAARRLLQAHASESTAAPLVMYRYLRLARTLGPEVDRRLADPEVYPLHRLARQVARETHRLKGLIRFREMAGDWWYAPVAPQYATLPFLAPHFARRPPGERWLLHDCRRGTGVVGRGRQWRLQEVRGEYMAQTAGEEICQDLWRAFYRAVAIPERYDDRRRRQNLPRYYWRHLVELEPQE